MKPVLLVALLVTRAAIAADTVPPAILAEPIASPSPGDPLRVRCEIVDESAVFQPTFYWRAHGPGPWEPLLLRPAEGAAFEAELPVPPRLHRLDWYLEAYDAEGNGPARFASPQEPQEVEVPYWEPSHALGWSLVGAGAAAVVVALVADLSPAGEGALAGAGVVAAAGGVTLIALDF